MRDHSSHRQLLARAGLVIVAVLMASPAASADFVGLRVFREEPGGPGAPPPGPERWIYRVYAEFTSTGDSARGWGAGTSDVSQWGVGGIWNITSNGSPGSGFTNLPDGETGNIAPMFPGTGRDWDTYMTIGLLYGYQGPSATDFISVVLGTPLFIANGSHTWTGGAVFLHTNFEQGYADYRITGNDTDHRVLLMQLVVNAGEHVSGSIGVLWRPDGSTTNIVTPDLYFTSIPEPSILGLFGLRWFLVRNRRR